MASLTVTPSDPKTGQPVIVNGSEFAPSTVVTIQVTQLGLQSEVTSDAAGYFGSDDVADHAVQTLTLSGNAVAAETITLGAVTYTWRAAPTTVANEVKVGVDAATSLANLKKAINQTGVSGTDYGSGTVIHPTITALTLTPTTLVVYAKTGGTGGNSLASTETMTNGAFGAATLAGGSAATGVSGMLLDFESAGKYEIVAFDGTNTVKAYVQVWEG